MSDEELLEDYIQKSPGHPFDKFQALVALDKLRAWKVALIDALVVNFIYSKEHDIDPRKALNDLINWEQRCALDPAISAEARALIDRGLLLAREAGDNPPPKK